ncbi:MAG: hypothetical protein K6G10_01445 [Butyrivibrio sp.]|nr:hypothetical protein [Butyrivibrio sp.]
MITRDVHISLDAVSLLYDRPNIAQEVRSSLIQGDPFFDSIKDLLITCEDVEPVILDAYDNASLNELMKYVTIRTSDISFEGTDENILIYKVPCTFANTEFADDIIRSSRTDFSVKNTDNVKAGIPVTKLFFSNADEFIAELGYRKHMYNKDLDGGTYIRLDNSLGLIVYKNVSLEDARIAYIRMMELVTPFLVVQGPFKQDIYSADEAYDAPGTSKFREWCEEHYDIPGWVKADRGILSIAEDTEV